jgi:hypothetical protein
MDETRGLARMTADTDSEASTLPQPHAPRHAAGEPELTPPGRRFGLTGGHWLVVVRLLVAVGVSAVLCLLLDRFAAPSLPIPTDVVGYPTFMNFNSERYLFWPYRLTVYAFPLFAIIGYVLLARFGPLRSRGPRPAKRTIELVEPVPTAPPTPEQASWGALARVLLPAAVVVEACGARTGHTDLIAVAAGVVYAAVVAAVAEVWARRTDGQRWRALSTVNGVGGAVAAVLGLWFVSAHTVVQTATGTRSWPWLVWWLPVLGVVTIGWWATRQLRGGRAARDVELTLLTVVVGAIALFLAVSYLPEQLTRFQGFDDSLDAAGASVLARGYFPWRDMLFVHGLYPDVLAGSLGRAIFGDSIWGVHAFDHMIQGPLFLVNTYLFAVWVSRRNPWFLALFFLGVIGLTGLLMEWQRFMGQPVSGLLLEWVQNISPGLITNNVFRFVALPVIPIVLGETLRRRSVAWAVGLTLLLFVEEILVPETIYLGAPALACVVAAELVHRRSEQNLWTSLRLTRWCVGTGLAATAVWAAFLAAFGALRAFIDYYLVLWPGHNLEAAWPPRLRFVFYERTMFALDVGFVMLTVLAVAIKVARRADWEVRDWVAVAAGAFTALYLEKAVAAFDDGHVRQVFFAGLPLVLLWSWRLVDGLGRLLAAWWRGWGARPVRFAHPVTAVLVPVIALGLVYAGALRKVEGHYHLAGVTESSLARVGYAAPQVIDTGLLRDLDTAIRAYAGDDGPVFDMTQSPGYLYFLLGRVPGTRFINMALALNVPGQRLLIDELKTARPPVVIYDATTMGASAHGGTPENNITNGVRHYEVSEYLLRGWTPVLRTHGVLVMARNDLVGSRPLPALSTPPQTTDLYFSGYLIGQSCGWGATPNYLPVPDSSRATTLPVRPPMARTVVHYSGWAVDPATNLPASTVLITDGDRVVGTVTPTLKRPDVAKYLHQPTSVSGFKYGAIFDAAPVHPAAYSVGADGLAHPLRGLPAGSVTVLRLPDGSQVRVAPTTGGNFGDYQADVIMVGELQLPSGIDLRDYDLATLSSTGGFGGATVALTDQLLHEISASWLDQAGSSLTLRVGSCPQWYGYDPSRPLYVMQSGGPPITSVTLSAMRS